MTTTAAQGWLHIWQGMPVPIAVDWLMTEDYGERPEAVRLLLEAAAEWINSRRPSGRDGTGYMNCFNDHRWDDCLEDIDPEVDGDSVWAYWDRLKREHPPDPQSDGWLRWGDEAKRTVLLCKELATLLEDGLWPTN